MLISAATEETKRYLFNVYEPFNFDFVFKRTLVITSNLTNPESATEVVVFEYTHVISKKKTSRAKDVLLVDLWDSFKKFIGLMRFAN